MPALMTKAKAKAKWRKLVGMTEASRFESESEIDPDQERDWFDMAYGFMLALDFKPDVAMILATELQNEGAL